MKNKLLLLVGASLLSSGIYVQAGTESSKIDEIVPAFGGVAFTAAQTKSHSSKDGMVKPTVLGKQVDARMNAGDKGKGEWVRLKAATVVYNLSNTIDAKNEVRLELQNDYTNVANVAVEGSWKSN